MSEQPVSYTCDVCGFQAGELAMVVEHLRVEHGITDTAEVGSIAQADGRLVLRSGDDVTEIDLATWLSDQLGVAGQPAGEEVAPMRYVSYYKTRGESRRELPTLLRPNCRMAVTIVASMWENEHGKFWAAYLSDAGLPLDEVADTGTKLERHTAEHLYPQIVAAGYEWWD